MKRTICILLSVLLLSACDDGYLASESKEELVVEGWIESGRAPVVMVSTTFPVSSTPRPLSDISKHILRYAEVYIDHPGGREYLTACLSSRFAVSNYFTSPTLRGEVGESYRLHVKWEDYEATAVCTIPEPTPIDSAWFEKQLNDTSYVLKIKYRNNPKEGKFFQSFCRVGLADTALFKAVPYSNLRGSLMKESITGTFMKQDINMKMDNYFHPGETVAVKLASIEQPMYDFWARYTNSYTTGGSTTMTATGNLCGNVDGAIGYWAGYGISMREMVCGQDPVTSVSASSPNP